MRAHTHTHTHAHTHNYKQIVINLDTKVWRTCKGGLSSALTGFYIVLQLETLVPSHSWGIFFPWCMLSCFSCVRLLVTPRTVDHQAPLSMGFSSKNTVVDCHFCLQEIFPTLGSNPRLLCLLHWQAGSLPLVPLGKPSTVLLTLYLGSC